MAEPQIHMNLDALEDRTKPDYVFTSKGREFRFTDPAVLDWQIVEGLSTVDALADHCMSKEDRKAFYETPLASYKLGILFEDVQKHFQLGEYQPKRRA